MTSSSPPPNPAAPWVRAVAYDLERAGAEPTALLWTLALLDGLELDSIPIPRAEAYESGSVRLTWGFEGRYMTARVERPGVAHLRRLAGGAESALRADCDHINHLRDGIWWLLGKEAA